MSTDGEELYVLYIISRSLLFFPPIVHAPSSAPSWRVPLRLRDVFNPSAALIYGKNKSIRTVFFMLMQIFFRFFLWLIAPFVRRFVSLFVRATCDDATRSWGLSVTVNSFYTSLRLGGWRLRKRIKRSRGCGAWSRSRQVPAPIVEPAVADLPDGWRGGLTSSPEAVDHFTEPSYFLATT